MHQTTDRRVLYISHDHPDVHVGGAEVHAYELYQAMREAGGFEPILLARSLASGHRGRRTFRAINDDPHQIVWVPEAFDHFLLSSPHKHQYTRNFRDFLAAYRPDVIHIQHLSGLGYDLIREAKSSLPSTPIVFTLHEFLSICHAEGHMLRTGDQQLCQQASPLACHNCFPDIAPQRFFLRERLIKSHLAGVDLFLAPSRQLLERYVDWGVPRAKLRFLDYGRQAQEPAGGQPTAQHFGYFGQISPHKGILVLLQAMRLLGERGDSRIHLFLSGANLEFQSQAFQDEFAALLAACDNVTYLGPYTSEQIAARMRQVAWVVVPSIWWENSPLVIQEAFMHRRPVICSDIGGMAEKVSDGVDGLHFRVGDAVDLAATIERAASSSDWEKLRDGIPEVFSMTDAVAEHTAIYRELVDRALSPTEASP